MDLNKLCEVEFEEKLIIKKPKVFCNPDYIPNKIFESKNLKNIIKDIANFLVYDKTFNKLIIGKKGIGKTVNLCYLKNKFNCDLDVKKALKGQKEDLIIYLNLKNINTTPQILKEIMIQSGVIFKKKESILSQFKTFFRNKKLIIILDEVENFQYNSKTNNSIFNTLSIINSNIVDFCLIMITNDITWLDKYRKKDLDFNAKIHLRKEDKLNWNELNEKEILEVLKLRIEDGIIGKVPIEILEETSALTFSKYYSNIRDALPTLFEVLELYSKGEKYDIDEIMCERHKDNILETLLSLQNKELMILFLSSYFSTSSEIFKLYNLLCPLKNNFFNEIDFIYPEVSKPTFIRMYNKLGELKNLVALYHGKSRNPDEIKLVIDKKLVRKALAQKLRTPNETDFVFLKINDLINKYKNNKTKKIEW